MTFQEFMKEVDSAIGAKVGLGVYDFADAPWRDLYDDTEGKATPEDIFETLAEYDDIFAAMLEEIER